MTHATDTTFNVTNPRITDSQTLRITGKGARPTSPNLTALPAITAYSPIIASHARARAYGA